MRISLERTGGFAGISKKISVDTVNLPKNEVHQLPQLLAAANFFNLPTKIATSPTQPDHFQYKLTVENEGQQHTVTVNEAALPGTLKPLIEWLNHVERIHS